MADNKSIIDNPSEIIGTCDWCMRPVRKHQRRAIWSDKTGAVKVIEHAGCMDFVEPEELLDRQCRKVDRWHVRYEPPL